MRYFCTLKYETDQIFFFIANGIYAVYGATLQRGRRGIAPANHPEDEVAAHGLKFTCKF